MLYNHSALKYIFQDHMAYLVYLVKSYSFVSQQKIGFSYQGRPLVVLKVCQGGCGMKKAVWIDGGMHPREWITQAAVSYFIRVRY